MRSPPPLHHLAWLAGFALASTLPRGISLQEGPQEGGGTPARGLTGDFASLPLSFEPAAGRGDPDTRFVARAGGGLVLVQGDGAWVLPAARGRQPLRLRFVGSGVADAVADDAVADDVVGDDELPGRVHLIRGDDPSLWRTDLPTFARVVQRGVWPGVDVVWRGDGRAAAFDFAVAAGADAERIEVSYPGADSLDLAADGSLVVRLPGGDVRQTRPRVFEVAAGGARREIAGEYALRGGCRVGFRLPDRDPARAVLIDPTLAYGTFLGGTGSETILDATTDADGSVYLTGSVASADFPLASPLPGAPAGGSIDAFVSKISRSGRRLVFSTYLGGSGADTAWSIRANSSGIVVAGSTISVDFPRASPLQPLPGGGSIEGDGFVTKLGPTGSTVLWSTYLGGSLDDGCRGLALDAAHAVYVAGFTSSTDFPRPAGAAPHVLLGPVAAWVAKLDRFGTALGYARVFGGTGATGDFVEDLAVDAEGNAYAAGFTDSRDLPATAGAFRSTHAGGSYDGFVTWVEPSGQIVRTTYLGGELDDAARRVALGPTGDPHVAGFTLSGGFPRVNALQGFRGGMGTGDAFVTRLDRTLASVVFSTHLGGRDDEDAQGLAVDGDGNVHVAGSTTSPDFPLAAPLQGAFGGDRDAFVATLGPDGTPLVFSSYLGTTLRDAATAVASAPGGDVVVAGFSGDLDLTTDCSAQPGFAGGGQDGFALRITNRPEEAPPVPEDLTAAIVSPWRVDVSWTDPGLQVCFQTLERRVGDGHWEFVAELEAGETIIVDDGLEPGSTYAWRVRAENRFGASEWSEEVLGVTPMSMYVVPEKGLVVDALRAGRDRVRVTGRFGFQFLPGSDGEFDPATEPFTLDIGPPTALLRLAAPAGDAGWSRKGERWTWKTPKRARPRAKLVLDFERKKFDLTMTRSELTQRLVGPIALSLRLGDDAGRDLRDWRHGRPGQLRLP